MLSNTAAVVWFLSCGRGAGNKKVEQDFSPWACGDLLESCGEYVGDTQKSAMSGTGCDCLLLLMDRLGVEICRKARDC